MARIVHLGLGNFHRAHQAWYTAQAGGDWHITGVAMTNRGLCDTLIAQGGYTLVEQGPQGPQPSRVAVHDRALVLRDAPGAVVSAIADPDTAIVTLTITEKGYGLDHQGHLDANAPGTAAALAGDVGRSAIAALAHGLAGRRTHGRPITLLSCDNLSDNGPKLRRAVLGFADRAGLTLPTAMTFPSTVVDRITPATTDALCARWSDPAVVLTEAFTEWVIEDTFAGARPAWQVAGAVFTEDVAPYEARKLHILNAAHSLLAYAGPPRGHTYVHQAIADPALRSLVEALWREAETLLPPSILDTLPAYRAALSDRFSVPEMAHRLDQIAQDGAQKMPIRIMPILRARLAAGLDAPGCETALAAWIAHTHRQTNADGAPADSLTSCLRAIGAEDLPAPVQAKLADALAAFA